MRGKMRAVAHTKDDSVVVVEINGVKRRRHLGGHVDDREAWRL